MTDRVKHRWKVTLQQDNGDVVEREVAAYWDPEKEGCADTVAVTAKAEAYMASNKQHEYAPIAVALVA